MNIEEVFGIFNFRGRVALEGEQGIVTYHAAAIVHHLDQLASATLHVHLDAGCTGIKGVLQQLLQDGSRALHHLSSGDFVGNMFGKNVDAAHKDSLITKIAKEHEGRANEPFPCVPLWLSDY